MSKALTSYLRTHRRKGGLTQAEMAYLLGLKSGQTISRHERLDRRPSLEIMFAYQVLFDALPHELCPGVYAKVEKITMRRIRILMDRLGNDAQDRLRDHKRAVLGRAMERAGPRRTCL